MKWSFKTWSKEKQAEAFLSLLMLGLFGASIALFIQEISRPWMRSFVNLNVIAVPYQNRLLMILSLSFIAAILAGGIVFFRKEASGVSALRHWVRFLLPFGLLGLLPSIFYADGWSDTLYTALLLTVFVLLMERALRVSLENTPRSISRFFGFFEKKIPVSVKRWGPAGFVVFLGVFYAITMSFYTIRKHQWFMTSGFDLGIYDNQFFNALHGHPFRVPAVIREGNWSNLKSHAEFSMYAFLPFYALAPRAETLLVIQAVFLGLGVLPLYRFASRHLSRWAACLLALAYVLYPPLHGANFYDFHFQPLATVFVFFVIDFLDKRSYVPFAIAFLLALGCREDISIVLAVMGLFLMVSGRSMRLGALISFISVVYFGVVKFLVMPHFGSWWFSDMYKGLYAPGDSNFAGILKTLFTNPAYVFRSLITEKKLQYTLQILLPLAFLPLRRGSLWLALVPGVLLTLLTTGYDPTVTIGFQYSCYWIMLLFPAVVLVVEGYSKTGRGLVLQKAALGSFLVATLLSTYQWGAIPPRKIYHAGFGDVNFRPPDEDHLLRARNLAELAALVPKEAILAVSDAELSHVSNRLDCYNLRFGYEGASYILYSLDSHWWGTDAGEQAKQSGRYQEIATRPGFVLLKAVSPNP